MLSAALVVQLLIMIGAPCLLLWLLRRKWHASLVLAAAGALAWTGSQMVHLPLNYGLGVLLSWAGVLESTAPWVLPLQATIAGLTAGLCEETARWLLLAFVLKRARSMREAVVFGAGHGGFESIWLGILVGASLLSAWATTRAGLDAMGVPAEHLPAASRQLQALWSVSPVMPLLAAAERLMTMFFHIAAAALVMLSVARKKPWLLVAAILWHGAADAVAVYCVATIGPQMTELVILGWMPICGLILWAVARAMPRADQETP